MELRGWNVIDADAGVLWREYHFTKGAKATTLVFRGADGLVVVSPACGLGAAEYDALREFGSVSALVSNNVLHHLGQGPWRAHFKDAVSYAPAGALGTLEKKTGGFGFRSLAELRLPKHVRCDDPPGFRTGDTIVSVGTKKGSVWFTSDLLTNITELPKPPLKWLFTLTGSAPGLKLFRLGVPLLVKDKRAVHAWAIERVEKDPPAVIVPAHGPAVETPQLAELAKAQIERL